MVTERKSANKWLAVLALGALLLAALGGTTPAMARLYPFHWGLSSQPTSGEASRHAEPTAPASLQARVIELEAASEQLAAKLARARRDLSDL